MARPYICVLTRQSLQHTFHTGVHGDELTRRYAGTAYPGPRPEGGERHDRLHHWPASISTSGDGMDKGISPEGGRSSGKTRRPSVDRGQLHATASNPGRG